MFDLFLLIHCALPTFLLSLPLGFASEPGRISSVKNVCIPVKKSEKCLWMYARCQRNEYVSDVLHVVVPIQMGSGGHKKIEQRTEKRNQNKSEKGMDPAI